MKFSDHFRDERQHRPDRQNITLQMCERVVGSWMKRVHQADGRTAYWGRVKEEERYLRVVVEPDGETVWTTHWDRNYKREVEREQREQGDESQI